MSLREWSGPLPGACPETHGLIVEGSNCTFPGQAQVQALDDLLDPGSIEQPDRGQICPESPVEQARGHGRE